MYAAPRSMLRLISNHPRSLPDLPCWRTTFVLASLSLGMMSTVAVVKRTTTSAVAPASLRAPSRVAYPFLSEARPRCGVSTRNKGQIFVRDTNILLARGLFGGAYRTRSDSNDGLIDGLWNCGRVRSEHVRTAMKKVDRRDYTPKIFHDEAYNDHPITIGEGQTISAPHMHAEALELLSDHLKHGAKVLDVGSGSGYLSVCMAKMVGAGGKVVGIEVIDSLVQRGVDNIKKNNGDVLEDGTLVIKKGDGWKGDPDNAPFDAIHVGAAAESLPEALVEQLKPGGRMLIPVGPQGSSQSFLQVDKDRDGKIHVKNLFGVVYVPLVRRRNQK
mmetsp:Transcript_17578/g.42901  ORF Transcript_17578/g.42901 Transcript_17578/m.42901 type:complete len:329 (-) Transcript_17578:128-1114(-)